MKICLECEEYFEDRELCPLCGSGLSPIATTNINSDIRLSEDFLDIFGDELRNLIQIMLSESDPSRSLSREYLKKISAIPIDSEKRILLDCYLEFNGNLRIPAVSGSFGPYLSDTSINGRIIQPLPEYADEPIINQNLDNSIVVVPRGKVSFARKAVNCQKNGVKCVVIIQNVEVWPFFMTDSARETEQFPVNIPVLMISKSDADVLFSCIDALKSKKNADPKEEFWCTIHSHRIQSECPICQEEMKVGETVMKLPCRHIYHEGCLLQWLDKHTNCPLCRSELPKAMDEASSLKIPSRQSENHPNSSPNTSQPYFR